MTTNPRLTDEVTLGIPLHRTTTDRLPSQETSIAMATTTFWETIYQPINKLFLRQSASSKRDRTLASFSKNHTCVAIYRPQQVRFLEKSHILIIKYQKSFKFSYRPIHLKLLSYTESRLRSYRSFVNLLVHMPSTFFYYD